MDKFNITWFGKMLLECCAFVLLPWKAVRLLHNFNASASTFDWGFETLIIDSSLTLKRVTTTRWPSRADTTKALKHDYRQIKDVLKQIDDDIEEKGCVRCEANGLLK